MMMQEHEGLESRAVYLNIIHTMIVQQAYISDIQYIEMQLQLIPIHNGMMQC